MAVALNLGADGALLDYSDLFDKVKLWLDRGSELDAYIPTFIRLAEGYLNRVLRTPQMEASTTLTAFGGTFALPLDCLQVRGLNGRLGALTVLSPAVLLDTYGDRAGCNGRAYAISGRTVRVAPSSDETLTLSYWQRIPSLSANNPSNWLFADSPDVYLYGALSQAEAYIDNPERVAQWTAAFEGCVDQVATAGNKARWGGPIVARSGVRAVRGIHA